MKDKWVLNLNFAALAVLFATLCFVSYSTVLCRRMETQSLVDVAGINDAVPGETRASVLVVFQEGDCTQLFYVFAGLNDVYRRRDSTRVRVSGVVLYARGGQDVLQNLAAIGDIDFPIRHASSSRAVAQKLRGLGFDATPVVLVFDAPGHVRAAAPALEVNPGALTVMISQTERAQQPAG